MFNQPYGWGGYPPTQYPQQPVVFIPPQNTDPVETIQRQIVSLEAMKKMFKEEKKEEKKDKKDEDINLKIINMVFLMLLMSPITGSIVFRFFQWGANILPH